MRTAKKYTKPQKKMFCVCCQQEVMADLVGGRVIYPHRPDLFNRFFYMCPKCGNYAGECANAIPTAEIRKARRAIHNVIDPLWKSGAISRPKIYKMLSDALGVDFHSGSINSMQMAQRAYTEAVKIAISLDSEQKICSKKQIKKTNRKNKTKK